MYFDRFSREVAEEYIKRLLEKHEREMVQNNANPYIKTQILIQSMQV